MSQIKWDDEKYSVGLQVMDDEHKMIIGLINVIEQHKEDQKTELLDRVFSTLDVYVKKHFAHEEMIMVRMSYPKLDEHRKQHKIFVKNLKVMKESFEKGKVHLKLIESMLEFLTHWLLKHIMIEDKDYGKYLTHFK